MTTQFLILYRGKDREDSRHSKYSQEKTSVWHLGEGKREINKMDREMNLLIIIQK